MTDEQYKEIIETLRVVIANQEVLNNRLKSIKSEGEATLSNTLTLARDQDVMMEDIKGIKRLLKK